MRVFRPILGIVLEAVRCVGVGGAVRGPSGRCAAARGGPWAPPALPAPLPAPRGHPRRVSCPQVTQPAIHRLRRALGEGVHPALSTFAALSATPSTKKLLLSNLDAVLSASTCRCQVKTFEVALKHALVSGRSVLSISCLPRLYCAPKEHKRVLRLIRSGIWANTNLRELDIQLRVVDQRRYVSAYSLRKTSGNTKD